MLHLCEYTAWNCPTWTPWWGLHVPKAPVEKDCEHLSGDDENFVRTNWRNCVRGAQCTSLKVRGMSCDNTGRKGRRVREAQWESKWAGVDSTPLQTEYDPQICRQAVQGVSKPSNSAMNQHPQGLSKNTGNGPNRNWEDKDYGEDQGKKTKFCLEKKKREWWQQLMELNQCLQLEITCGCQVIFLLTFQSN